MNLFAKFVILITISITLGQSIVIVIPGLSMLYLIIIRSLNRIISEIEALIEQGPSPELAIVLQEKVALWLIYHITVTDMEYRHFYENR